MRPEIKNKNKNCEYNSDYVGRDKITNNVMLWDSERDFVVTHNAKIKSVSYFIGRETELQELRQRIEEKRKSVLVSGMGGIGKTQICRKLFEEYLSRHASGDKETFQHIGYIEYSGTMDSSLEKCLKYMQQDHPEQNREAAWKELEHLASDGKLLLFVDNVDKTVWDDEGLQRLSYIPGVVVLTSRQESLGDEFENYRIGFLSLGQCKEIYWKICFKGNCKETKSEEVRDLEFMIEELTGRHTITIELLAHLAYTKHWSVKKLREELQQKGFCLEFRKNGELVNIQKSYEVLYDFSKLTKAERNILEAFSVFPYIPLSAETCDQWLLADAGVKEEDDVLAGLQQKGWLQFEADQEGYALHPVFAQFIYEKCKPRVEDHCGLLEACQECIKVPSNGSAIKCRSYIPFAESIAEKFEMGESTATFMMVLAFTLRDIGEFKKAEELYKRILRIIKQLWGEENLYTAICYDNFAGVYDSQDEYGKAKELYEKSLRIIKQLLGEENANTAVAYMKLVEIYREQGEYGKAKELCEKNLRIAERSLGEENPYTVMCYHNLAMLYKEQDENKKAKELYRKSIRIMEQLFGEVNRYNAISYHNLAGIYKKQGKYGKAKELYEKSLRIVKQLFGEENINTAAVYHSFAGLYEEQDEYAKAKELYEKSLRITKQLLGEEHPRTARCYHELARTYIFLVEQDKFKKAITYMLKAYSILSTRFGIDHRETQIVRDDLKLLYSVWKPDINFDQWIEVLKDSDLFSE